MSYAAGVMLLVFAVVIVIGAVLQVVEYRRGRHIISPRQMAMRLATGVLLLAVIAMIFVGVTREWPMTRQGVAMQLVFWGAMIVLLVGAMVLAMADLRQVERQRHLRQAELYRAIQELADRTSQEGKKK